MDFDFLKAVVDETGVAVVKMARPPVNAVNQEMYIQIASFFSNPDQIGRSVRAIVLAAEGPQFCAGNDLDEFASMTPANGTERMWRVREAFFAIQSCPIPVIGAVHGVALGTGLAIAASCDFVVAAPGAKFGLPELTVGVFGGARHLARIAPGPLVRRMFFTGIPLTATEFARQGGSIIVSDSDDAVAGALKFASRIASFSPTAVRFGKSILNQIESMDVRSGYEFEQSYTVKMSGHSDSKEALEAFRQKRVAKYRPIGLGWKPDF
jgi:enoyl-CoA hydratase